MLAARCRHTTVNTHLSYTGAGNSNTLLSFHAADGRGQGDDAQRYPDGFSCKLSVS